MVEIYGKPVMAVDGSFVRIGCGGVGDVLLICRVRMDGSDVSSVAVFFT